MSLAKLHRTMPTTVWIYPTCCHTFGKSPTNVKDFQKIPTNSKRFHYNLENSNFPGGQSLLGDFSYFYNTWQTECLRCFGGYCKFAKSIDGRFAAGDRILGKVLMTIRRPSLQCGHLVSRVMINAESSNTYITIGHYMQRESTQKLFTGQ